MVSGPDMPEPKNQHGIKKSDVKRANDHFAEVTGGRAPSPWEKNFMARTGTVPSKGAFDKNPSAKGQAQEHAKKQRQSMEMPEISMPEFNIPEPPEPPSREEVSKESKKKVEEEEGDSTSGDNSVRKNIRTARGKSDTILTSPLGLDEDEETKIKKKKLGA